VVEGGGGGGSGTVSDIRAGRIVWQGFGGTLNDNTTKGYEISSLGGDGFNNLGARAIDTVWTA
jgi:hypothetical protein